MELRRQHSGFTLIETMITLIILGIVGVSLFSVLHVSKGSVEDQKAVLEAQQNARVGLNSIAEDFRHVSYGKDATQPSIYYADVDSVVFVADLFQNIPGAEVISYYLSPDGDADTPNPNDTVLMKTIVDTTGNVLVNAPQSYGLAASGLTLTYLNGNGVELAAPVAQPETVGEIQILVSGVSPRPLQNGDYHTITLSTTVYPRNLPLTPARSRPNVPGTAGVSAPNCESVTVSWVVPTTNTDGTPLEFNDISHFNFYMGFSADNMDLNARLARTFTTWTVGDLMPGNIYYFGVTCVSRAGVESYPMTVQVDLSSGFIPSPVAGLSATVTDSTADLTWDPVTTFTDGSTITTPVVYNVHRALVPGAVPDTTNLVTQTDEGVTTYLDAGLAGCSKYYYQVTAMACANTSDPSPEALAQVPAAPACVPNLTAVLGTLEGEVDLAWSLPTNRQDGSLLALEDISHYTAYFDTIPGGSADSLEIPADHTTATLDNLLPCRTYYINIRAYDTCLNRGEICAANEAVISTSSPCTPGPPVPPSGLITIVGTSQVQLKWPANTTDCDLEGYRVWYGTSPGGPYSGVGAAEGNSPITFRADDITSGSLCIATVNGLDLCTTQYFVVSAIDQCSPFNESSASEEVTAGTNCISCNVEATCSPWLALGGEYSKVLFSVHSGGTSETLDEIRAQWSTGGGLVAVTVDGQPVWAADGSAGDDGPTGPADPGQTLHTEPFTISNWTTPQRGVDVVLVFDSDMRHQEIGVEFRYLGASCDVVGTPLPALMSDNFEDGDYNGWTVTAGNWGVDSGMLFQTNPDGGSKWIYTSALSWGGDFVYEADVNMISEGYGILQYNRYASGYRYFSFLYYWGQSIHIASMLPSYADVVFDAYPHNTNTWYKLRVEREGSVYRTYADCDLTLESSIWPEPPAGRFGLGTYYNIVAFDNVRIAER